MTKATLAIQIKRPSLTAPESTAALSRVASALFGLIVRALQPNGGSCRRNDTSTAGLIGSLPAGTLTQVVDSYGRMNYTMRHAK